MKHRATLISVILVIVVLVVSACSSGTGGNNTTPAATTAAQQPAAATAAAPKATTPAGAATASAPAAVGTPAAARPTVPPPPADNSRPLAKVAAKDRNDRFGGPAPMTVVSNTIYIATIVTDKGNIVAELYQDTPISNNNFVTLAKDGFYDGLTFHRVEPGFVIQGGDPLGSGSGGPGYTIPAEIKHNHLKGALAWARTSDEVNPNRESSGSQFYITLADVPQLDGGYTVFGQVIQGMDVAEKIAVGDKIKEIDITQGQTSQLPTPTPTRPPLAPKPADGRPLAQTPVAQRAGAFNQAPAMTIDPSKTYTATINTAKGNVVIDLDAKTAPQAVNSFVVLANLGYYDGMPVTYVSVDTPQQFVVFGSPAKRPDSDAGYSLNLDQAANAQGVITGTVSLYSSVDPATQQPKASGSLFYIWLSEVPQLNTPLAAFGKVSSGLDVLRKLTADDVVTKIEISTK